MPFKTRDGKTHQSTVLIGENGMAVDSIATISGSYVFLENSTEPLEYIAASATVTLPVGSDLGPVSTAKARYTGRYVLITQDNAIYYINRQSIDVVNRTFTISRSDATQINPLTINLSPGWTIAEADIVNRMATTSAAKIDSVEFRDMHFQMQLDGDPVTITDDDGDKLEINPDGSINAKITGLTVNQPTVVNLNMPTLGSEYRLDFPDNVRRFTVKARGLSKVSISYTSGGAAITVSPGCVYEESNILRQSSLSLYIKSNKPNTVVEAVYWT